MPSRTTEQIKDRLSITDVVGAYIQLEKAGSNMRARCPFHNEKTPSFFVSPSRNTYYCFGCGAKGDIFSFVEQFEGLDFSGALRILGERAGVPIVFESKEVKNKRTRLYEVLENATFFFEQNLEKEVQKYLVDRGLKEDTLKLWRIGYTHPEWRKVYDHLKDLGFTEKEIENAGLIKKVEKDDSINKYYDRFRGRIMFPIFDSSGRVVAFSGRIFPAGGGSASGGEGKTTSAKYINSPETELFHKSKILYGFDKAKKTMRKVNFSIVVEGQMDLLMSHQSGFTNTVALSGTALSQDHLIQLSRLSKNIVMAFDADNAGIQSSGKSATMALSMGMDVKVATLPKGTDPADLVKKDKEEWRKAIRQSKHIVEFYLDILTKNEKNKRKLRLKVQEIVVPYVAQIRNKIDQAHFVATIASRLGISEEPIWEEVRNARITTYTSTATEETEKEDYKEYTRKDIIEKQIVGIMIFIDKQKAKKVDSAKQKKKFKSIIGVNKFKKLMNITEGEIETIIFEAERTYGQEGNIKEELDELLINLEEEYTKEEFTKALNELKYAEEEGKSKKINLALKKCKELSEKLVSTGSG